MIALLLAQVPYWTEFSRYEHPVQLAGQVRQESGYNPCASSPVGAIGLGQHMPQNRPWYIRMGWMRPQDDLWTPSVSIHVTSRYMGWLLGRNRGDWALSWASYNWGLGNVQRVQRATRARGITDTPERRAWLLLAPAETQGYVQRIEDRHIPWVEAHR